MGNHQVLALLLSRLTAEEERRLKRSVSRSVILMRFCEDALRNKDSGEAGLLPNTRQDYRAVSRESTRKLVERLLSHVLQVLAGSPEVHEGHPDEMDASQASEFVKCGVLIAQSLGNRGVPERWILNYLDKRADLCRSFGLLEDLVVVEFQRWHIIQRVTLPVKASEPQEVYHGFLKATENMRFMVETEQFLFNYLDGPINCFTPGAELLSALDQRVADISLFNHRNRFAFLGFVQLILQSRLFFGRGDAHTGARLVGEVVVMADEFSEVAYRLRNSPFGNENGPFPLPGEEDIPLRAVSGKGVLLRFPRFFGLVHEPVILDLIYRREIELAATLLQQFLPPAGSERALNYPARWFVMQAFVLFLKGEWQRASQLIRCLEGVPEGKSVWGMGVRLLSIYISLEKEALDLASHQVESLRKSMERQQRVRPFTNRENLVLRLLCSLMRSDFDYRKVAERHSDDLVLLASDAPGYAWQQGGYELLPFHEWLSAKVRKGPQG